MVVCKYFLQGTCKFGAYCHYEHQAPSNYTSFGDSNHQSTSILRQANFSSTQPQNTKSTGSSGNVDINTLVKSVVNDMTGAEKGGQWLLSCYAPFKEKPGFPGFEDHSPEEIRLGFYEAQKNNTLEQYKTQLQTLFQNSMVKIKALQNPAQDVVTLLQNIYNIPPSSCSGTYGQNVMTASTASLNQQNAFTSLATQNKSAFGQNNDNIFKTNTQGNTTNIFGGSGNFSGWQQNQGHTNVYGNLQSSPTQNQSIFGDNTFGKNQNNIFGSQPGNNIFGTLSPTPTISNNIFAAQASPVAPSPSVFTGTQQPTNIFAPTIPTNQSQNLFSSTNINQQSIFGQQANQQTQQNIFTQQNQSQNVQTQNIFSAQNQKQQQQNIFSNNTNATQFSISQPNTGQLPPPNYSASIFGSVNSNPPVSFGSTAQQPVDEKFYSKLEELTVEEKSWFESNTLDIINIPDKPPTYEMCFKV